VLRHSTALRLSFGLAAVLLAIPAGAGATTNSGTGGTAPPPQQPAAPGQPSGGAAVTVPRSAYVHDRVPIGGRSRRARRRVVLVEARQAGGVWWQVARVRADRKGAFSAVWQPNATGVYELRARIGARPSSSNGGVAVPVAVGAVGSGAGGTITVYRPAIATWYGPGFFGSTTACGQVLQPDTLGVANRDLPCGTQVQIAYRGRAIVVPVIDRGPYANGADWDLTQAAAQQLGMSGTSRVGAMRVSPTG
jgi:rare lipoprotein A